MSDPQPNVKKITMTREEMKEAIEKAATESNSDYYICPFCCDRKRIEYIAVHKTRSTGNFISN